MASYTTNLNLKKPAGSENVAIGDINNNMDTIDTAYGTINSKLTATVESGNVIQVGSYYDSLSLIRFGDIKQISMVITGSNTKVPATGSYVKVAGLPTSCKSLYGVATTMANLDGHHFLLRVTSSGDLELYNPVQDQAINGSFAFIYI